MKDKQKVTLYIPPELHRQLKIQSAVDSEPMSAIAERALELYLEHSETLSHGRTHQIHSCPKCSTEFVLRGGEALAIGGRSEAAGRVSPHVIEDTAIAESSIEESSNDAFLPHQERDPEELVPC
ncbi:MAG: hypothetical protein ACFB4J_07735 [Elainellaceae cyanobacterium]